MSHDTPRQMSGGRIAATEPRRTRVLLVEDEPALAEAFRRVLASAGFEVSVCRTGMDALLLLRPCCTRVDVVLSDVGLPGMTGDSLAREIRQRCPGLPVLLMTGFSTTVTPESAHLLGVTAVLQKPIAPSLLVEEVRRAVLATGAQDLAFQRRPGQTAF